MTKIKDSNLRVAIINRFGGSKAVAIGTKRDPGKLYGVKADAWQALALALAFIDAPERAFRFESFAKEAA